jgi:hypothetical protein
VENFEGDAMMLDKPSRPALPPPLAKLLNELEADHAFGPEVVEPMRVAALQLDREADDISMPQTFCKRSPSFARSLAPRVTDLSTSARSFRREAASL